LKSFLRRLLCVVLAATAMEAMAAESITGIQVRGNAKVEPDAIITILDSRIGTVLDSKKIQSDIKKLFELGYFSDVRVFKKEKDAGVELIVEVVEKPAIVGIEFDGFEEVTSDEFKDKLETKLYTIVNDATIASDLRVIEKKYAEKGFFLASASYRLEPKGPNEVVLHYVASEGTKVRVGDVEILGNKFFTDADVIDKLMSKPLTRGAAYSSVGSMYNDEFVNRDLEFLSLYYRDFGFAKVKVAKPIIQLDADRQFASITFQVEEGEQYNVGSIELAGDLLYPKEELIEAMKLKPGELFRYSKFRADVEMLIDKYGDLGYAFVDVDPRTPFDDQNRTVAITYNLTKGEKVYFGKMSITGNGKTRDNVIRREITVADTELYSGTKLRESKANVERLGFFEEVQAIKSRDPNRQNVLDYNFKVKEKPTGQLQAAIGYQPETKGGSESSVFGQGRYNEENQSGRGWKANLTGKWNGEKSYDVSAGLTDPRVNDSDWSLGFSLFTKNEVVKVTSDIEVTEHRDGGSVTAGRTLFEQVRGNVTYRMTKITQSASAFLLSRFKEDGTSSAMIFGLRRNKTNNYIDPTSGSDLQINQTVTGGPFGGDHQFMESSWDGSVYIPWDFTESYRTYFRFHNILSYIYPYGGREVPLFERYKLGGPMDMRGYDYKKIGPTFGILQAPGGGVSQYPKGGDKQFVFQAEYFMPLIQEAGIKAIFFADAGNVYDDHEPINLGDLKYDYGFGLRWITPVAPFRFEWAYPVEDGVVGEQKFIFYLGY